jgi:hypothetical protein
VGFICSIKGTAPECTNRHCIIHRPISYSLSVKEIPNALKTVLNEAVTFVNFTDESLLNSRIFSAPCDEVDSSYTTALPIVITRQHFG